MATPDAQAHVRQTAAAASTPATISATGRGGIGDLLQHLMPYTCQACAKRKVKCDKTTPICSSCRKSKLECLYQAPAPPKRRRRRLSGDVDDGKLARYEKILHQHGLLPQESVRPSSPEHTPQVSDPLCSNELQTSNTGKLVAGQGKSRYIDSNLWHNLGDGAMQRMSDDENEDHVVTSCAGDLAPDPLTGAFMGSQQSLLQYHPTHAEAMLLWKTYTENVEPICKILHIPSLSKMVEMVSRQPAMASNVEDCLFFAVYHFAVFSLTEEGCAKNFGQSRGTLLQRYHFATRQALVNASFLRSTEMAVMQALVLFLLAGRYSYDPHTYWILTGVAVRVAQRMGLHRDGENQGLPPFEIQMRRRLFYQLIPLDGVAGHMSGTGIATMPDDWDTQPPLNINDDQIWPGMTDPPDVQSGATEMIYCLTRACVGKSFLRARKPLHSALAGSGQAKDFEQYEAVIVEAEREVEERFIRYCDIVDPLHFLSMCLARSAITAMRVRIRLPKARDQAVTDTERRELFHLAEKVLDTDAAACAHVGLRKYMWVAKPFFAWGSWDSVVFLSSNLGRGAGLLSTAETDGAWSRLMQVYHDHAELLDLKRALHVAVGRLTVKAWEVNPPSVSVPEPASIAALRSLLGRNSKVGAGRQSTDGAGTDGGTLTVPSLDAPPADDGTVLPGSLSSETDLDFGNDFGVDTADWVFWDKLIQDYQAQDYQERNGVSH
ncbi:hypothetical protein LTR85_009309 [Meristemomyces frigidus]|nr:hypothetical protein LTR85_009309 [Meristemomyces frigidus]